MKDEKNKVIKSGCTKYITLGGFLAWIEITQSEESVRITKQVLIPRDKYEEQPYWRVLREGKSYVYIQEVMYIQMEVFKALTAFIFFD